MTIESDPEIRDVSTRLTTARYNRIAPLYNFLEAIPETMFKRWRKMLLAKAKGKILEIGVGTGKNFPHYPSGARVTGIDIAERMLVIARIKASELGLSFDLREGDVQRLDFPDHSFDTVVATFVFCSVPDPVQGLRELRRVVRPSGRILLLEHVRIDRPIIGWMMDRLNPLIVRVMGANINRRTLENVKRAGLGIESVDHFGLMKMVKMIAANTEGIMMPDNSLKITLLVTPECHLCEDAEIIVQKVCGRLSLRWEKINIEDHPELYDRYKEEIPVLLVDGRKLFKYRTKEPTLMKSLSRRLSSC